MKLATKPKPNGAYRPKWRAVIVQPYELEVTLNDLSEHDWDITEIITMHNQQSSSGYQLNANGEPLHTSSQTHTEITYQVIARKWYIPGVDEPEEETNDEIPF